MATTTRSPSATTDTTCVLHALRAGIVPGGRAPKNFITDSRPETMAGLCWMYSAVSHIGASAQCPPSSRSRSMCIAACLLVLSFGSALVNSDSGSVDATTGACANSGAVINNAANSETVNVSTSFDGFMRLILASLLEEFHHEIPAFVFANPRDDVESMVVAGEFSAPDR